MAFEIVKKHFEIQGLDDRIKEFGNSCATVQEAAKTVGVTEGKVTYKRRKFGITIKNLVYQEFIGKAKGIGTKNSDVFVFIFFF